MRWEDLKRSEAVSGVVGFPAKVPDASCRYHLRGGENKQGDR
jgi:hypothetical protein